MKAKKNGFTLTNRILVVVAVGLLMFAVIGGARAALNYFSKVYKAPLAMKEIGIDIYENKKLMENEGELLTGLVPEGEEFQPGRVYDEDIDVKNSGVIDEYIRVVV